MMHGISAIESRFPITSGGTSSIAASSVDNHERNFYARIGAHYGTRRFNCEGSERLRLISPLPDVPGRAHRKDAFIAAGEQHPFQKPAALIVEEVFIPFVFHKLGYDDDDAAAGCCFERSRMNWTMGMMMKR